MSETKEKKARKRAACPFCGNETKLKIVPVGPRTPYCMAVQCGICTAIGPRVTTPEYAIKKWNRRKP